jgi:hypothetical protein
MAFVAANTNIPIPKVYCAFAHKGIKYIVMSRLHGVPVLAGWVQRSAESKARVLSQMREYVSQLRKLAPLHEGYVGSLHGNGVYDHHIPGA